MCDVGGPRCVLADNLHALRKRLKRSKEYQETEEHFKNSFLKEKEIIYLQGHPELVQACAPEREKWQVEAPPLSRRKREALRKYFPPLKPWEAQEVQGRTQELVEEHETLLASLPEEVQATLHQYTLTGHEAVNGYLRRGYLRREEGKYVPVETARERVAHLDEVFRAQPLAEEARTLHRHHLVPPGWTPRQYAEKYFPLGGLVRDRAFMSTTEDPAYLLGHCHHRRPSTYVLYQIRTRQGVSLTRDPREAAGDLQSLEKERLLPRNLSLRVVGHRRERLQVSGERKALVERFGSGYPKVLPEAFFTVIELVEEDLVEGLLEENLS